MAYFERKTRGQDGYSRKFTSSKPAREDEIWEEYEDEEALFSDGFDELIEEEPEEEIPEEELQKEKRRKYRVAAGFGDLGATLIGVGVILLLAALLLQMLQFVSTDISQNFSLLQTKF